MGPPGHVYVRLFRCTWHGSVCVCVCGCVHPRLYSLGPYVDAMCSLPGENSRASIKSNIKSVRENSERTQRMARPPPPVCASLTSKKLHNLNQPAISFKADAEVPHTQLAADYHTPL